MAPRSVPTVVVTYKDSPSPMSFVPTARRAQRSPSVDSGVELVESSTASKLQGVVITVPRRRFVRDGRALASARPASESASTAYRDFTLYPAGGATRSRTASGIERPSSNSRPADQPTGRPLSRTVPQVTPGDSSIRQRPGAAVGQVPPAPMPPRLPTPDIPDVNETTWWGK